MYVFTHNTNASPPYKKLFSPITIERLIIIIIIIISLGEAGDWILQMGHHIKIELLPNNNAQTASVSGLGVHATMICSTEVVPGVAVTKLPASGLALWEVAGNQLAYHFLGTQKDTKSSNCTHSRR